MNFSEDLTLLELNEQLGVKHRLWREAMQGGDYVWAAYYANDLEAIARRLTTITHNYVREHYADPESALGRHPSAGVPPKEGN